MSNTVGDGIGAQRGNWKFSGEASANFDAHVSKSVPLYTEGHQLMIKLEKKLIFFLKTILLIRQKIKLNIIFKFKTNEKLH